VTGEQALQADQTLSLLEQVPPQPLPWPQKGELQEGVQQGWVLQLRVPPQPFVCVPPPQPTEQAPQAFGSQAGPQLAEALQLQLQPPPQFMQILLVFGGQPLAPQPWSEVWHDGGFEVQLVQQPFMEHISFELQIPELQAFLPPTGGQPIKQAA